MNTREQHHYGIDYYYQYGSYKYGIWFNGKIVGSKSDNLKMGYQTGEYFCNLTAFDETGIALCCLKE